MTTIRAVVRDRRIDVAVPSDWADGTEVLLTLGSSTPDDDGPMSPEEIAAVLEAMQKIEPFDWSAEERAAADDWDQKVNEYSKLNMDKGIEDVFR